LITTFANESKSKFTYRVHNPNSNKNVTHDALYYSALRLLNLTLQYKIVTLEYRSQERIF